MRVSLTITSTTVLAFLLLQGCESFGATSGDAGASVVDASGSDGGSAPDTPGPDDSLDVGRTRDPLFRCVNTPGIVLLCNDFEETKDAFNNLTRVEENGGGVFAGESPLPEERNLTASVDSASANAEVTAVLPLSSPDTRFAVGVDFDIDDFGAQTEGKILLGVGAKDSALTLMAGGGVLTVAGSTMPAPLTSGWHRLTIRGSLKAATVAIDGNEVVPNVTLETLEIRLGIRKAGAITVPPLTARFDNLLVVRSASAL